MLQQKTSPPIRQPDGMSKLMDWLNKDISLFKRADLKKLSLRQQRQLIQLLGTLLANGFSLDEAIGFLERSHMLESGYTQKMYQALLDGKSLAQILSTLGFSDQLVTQISLADRHGNIQATLLLLDAYLNQLMLVRKKILEVLTYPVMLLGFLVFIMLGLKTYLLPQLEGENLATKLILAAPQLFLVGLLLLLIGLGVGGIWAKRTKRLTLYNRLASLPYLGRFISDYLTAYYAREWGNLIGQGLEMSQIVQVMQEQKSQLFQEIGQDLERSLTAGRTFQEQVARYRFFRPELSLIIAYGDIKAKLGTELSVYARETWTSFFDRVNRASQIIQPLVFVVVAIMIVMIYAAMLLPIYQSMPNLF